MEVAGCLWGQECRLGCLMALSSLAGADYDSATGALPVLRWRHGATAVLLRQVVTRQAVQQLETS